MIPVIAVGVGVAAAAFFVSSAASVLLFSSTLVDILSQGRAGLVALRKYRGGVTQAGALGKSFFKGGFEQRMNRREAALILQLKYVLRKTFMEFD